MEDCNTIAADCVVLSCCCQCLMLQLFIFILIKLPCKIARKTRNFALKKLRIRSRKRANKGKKEAGKVHVRLDSEFDELSGGSLRIGAKEFECGNCMEQVEMILEALSEKGEFSFGSFWGRSSSSTCTGHSDTVDLSCVQFEFVEFVHSFHCSD